MKTIRFLCLLLVVFSGVGMAGMLMDDPIVPIGINYMAIFVLSIAIVVMGNKRNG
ncbi:hypothetical protein NQ095_07270 [Rossellomorea sp. SC111]|uniref:hypothetical protein n=1 Tax=Rossellomorea sp. SC111 TaxID=2968985 RepID=UPI00215B1BAB|nr:hypothetical protein [Rossellomorea sp. SC111]MCR8848197.1 hypothetical protein [Rossellomorea sp. SC111]